MKVKYIICASAAALLFTSCHDFLQEDPKGQLTPSTFFSTQDELDMATYALYRKVCETQTNTNPTIPMWAGDDITTNPGSNKQDYAAVDAFRPANDNKGVTGLWEVSYTAIKAANYIVLNAAETPTTEDEINIAIGQAKFWRAVNFFRLVRCFGPIPLVLDTEVNYERTLASVEEVYAQIVQDLQDCINTLPTSYSTEPRYLNGVNVYITKQAAQATLGAVYMAMAGWPLNQTQYYAEAATLLKDVIDGVDSGDYEYILESDYKYVYAPSHNYSNETVVGINFSGSFTWAEDSQMTLSNLFESLGGWGDGWGEIKFWKEFPDGPRKDATYNPKILKNNTAGEDLLDWWDESFTEQHPMFCIFTVGEDDTDYDYTQPANTTLMTNGHRHRLIRYSEVLLWYAEAQARADGTPNSQAYECINLVRSRAGLDPLSSGMTGEAFANAAFQEHGWEVAGYWVAMVTRRDDLMRMNMLEDVFNTRLANEAIEVADGVFRQETITINDGQTWQGESSIYLPYPSSDSELNSNLTR